MGFLDNIFKPNKSTLRKDNSRLVECVQKIDQSDGGVFVNLYNDLGIYIERVGLDEDNLRKMAYAYARRATGAGLCAQGIWGEKELSYNLKIFNASQQITGKSIEFQEAAYEQAIELILSYDARLNKEMMSGIVHLMESSDNPSQAQNSSRIFTIDELLDMFNK
jgi:hypothetical protein